MVPRKSPKRITIPYSSTQNPIRGHLRRIRIRPAKKAAVPFAFCFLAKKRRVFCGPIIIVRPIRKRIWVLGQLPCKASLEVLVRTLPIASLLDALSAPIYLYKERGWTRT